MKIGFEKRAVVLTTNNRMKEMEKLVEDLSTSLDIVGWSAFEDTGNKWYLKEQQEHINTCEEILKLIRES